MGMMKAVACALGYVDLENFYVAERIRSIIKHLDKKPGDEGFKEACERAELAVNARGANVVEQMIGGLIQAQTPKERVYKIKPVAKGQRIEAISASGVRFSFGEVWCNSVRSIKGIAVNPNNREKLNMHGTHLGLVDVEGLTPRQLCERIIPLMDKMAA